MRFSCTPDQHRSGAPTMGEHNAEILGAELGLSDAELARLTRDGVIGDRMPGS
jgi:crotonobetainyl-CoA:carnitine CoA-transferase CaiB-like acyl-CoA transferase